MDKGNEIASHNQFHIKMDTLSDADMLRQMTESRIIAEKNLNSKVYTFVFPYSATRSNIFDLPREAGYIFARTGEESVNQSDNLNLEKLTTLAIYSEDVPNLKEIYSYINEAKGKWLILNYHNIFPADSKEMNLLKYHDVTATYSVTPETFKKQVRLMRNSDYWIAPINAVGRYVLEREVSKLEFTNHDNKIILKVRNDLDTAIYNIPLTVVFTTDWKIVKVVNSAEDGIYNPRNNTILINLYPNREVILEDLSVRKTDKE